MTSAPDAIPSKLPPRRRRWKTILLVLVIFFSGGVIGAAGATIYIVHQVRYAMRHPDEIPARLTARLTRRLSLTSQQQEQVRELIETRVQHVKGIRDQFQPKIRDELQGLHQDVDKVLTVDQQVKWDKLFDDFVDNWIPAQTNPAPESR